MTAVGAPGAVALALHREIRYPHASGAIGDLWMAERILRLPRQAIFYDLADGFAAVVRVDAS